MELYATNDGELFTICPYKGGFCCEVEKYYRKGEKRKMARGMSSKPRTFGRAEQAVFVENMRRYAKAYGKNMREICAYAGKYPDWQRTLRLGKAILTIEHVQAIANGCNLSVKWLLTDNGIPADSIQASSRVYDEEYMRRFTPWWEGGTGRWSEFPIPTKVCKKCKYTAGQSEVGVQCNYFFCTGELKKTPSIVNGECLYFEKGKKIKPKTSKSAEGEMTDEG